MELEPRWSVGLTTTLDVPAPAQEVESLPAGVTRRRMRLSEVVDPECFDPAGCAAQLVALADMRAQIDAFEAAVVKRFADLRPDLWDLNPDSPAAKVDGFGSGRDFGGVTEFFTDELAVVLGISVTRANNLANTALVLVEQLPATWAALADGRIDLPRARALVTVLGWQAPTVDPDIVAAVEREALSWAIAGEGPYKLQNRAAALLLEFNADAADRRRKEAARLSDVKVRNQRNGLADLGIDLLSAEVAAACWDSVDSYARMRKAAGDDRPIGQLRALVAADLLLRPWDTTRVPVTAHLTVFAPLPSLFDARFTATGRGHDTSAAGSATSAAGASTGSPGSAAGDGPAQPSDGDGDGDASTGGCSAGWAQASAGGADGPEECGWVDGQPITATHLRELLAQLDALCPGGLQAPAGGTMDLALTDPDTGALRAVITRHELERLARRGCPQHPDPPPGSPTDSDETDPAEGTGLPAPAGCDCPVLDMPAGTDAYRPTAAQRRFLAARDRTCRHPGCSRPARWTDIDHVTSHHAGGKTECGNLCNLCRRHHRLKTHAPSWRYSMTDDGMLSVTTPSGITRTSAPPGTHHRLRPDQLLTPLETARPPLPEPAYDPDDDPPPF